MIALLQRALAARVEVGGQVVGQIDRGLMVLVCAQRGDTEASAQRLAQKLVGYRVFADEGGRMNRSLRDLAPEGAGLLVVPQFTLAADTKSGTRPSFTPAADPARARELFEEFVLRCRDLVPRVATGVFGADMHVHLINDGPVTFWLETAPEAPR